MIERLQEFLADHSLVGTIAGILFIVWGFAISLIAWISDQADDDLDSGYGFRRPDDKKQNSLTFRRK